MLTVSNKGQTEQISACRQCLTYKVNHLARAEAVIQSHPALILWVLPPGQDILIAHVVWSLIHHPGPTLHPDGVAATQVSVKIGAVAVALITTALEVLVLEEDNLRGEHIRFLVLIHLSQFLTSKG